jgi:hypothetical protein
MAAAAAELLCARIDHHDTDTERRVFSAQFIEGATARLTPVGRPTPVRAATGLPLPVAIM